MALAFLETEASLSVQHVPAGEGETIDILGARLTFKTLAAETGNKFFVSELTVPPQAGVPLHAHPESETFFVLAGEVQFLLLEEGGPEAIPASPGSLVFVPRNAAHGLVNASETPARLLVTAEPGLEDFFRQAGVPVDPTAPLRETPPAQEEIEHVFDIARQYGHVIHGA